MAFQSESICERKVFEVYASRQGQNAATQQSETLSSELTESAQSYCQVDGFHRTAFHIAGLVGSYLVKQNGTP